MVEDAPNALASVADHPHPAPPSRLVSKHRPRRRAAASRPPLPPPAPALSLPDLTQCHCCGVRFPTPQPGAKPKRRPVLPLSSLWRVVLLCAECLSLVSSAAVCSYCLSLDNLPPEDSAVSCRRCRRFVHQSCIPAEHRAALIQPVDVEDFLCVDCCPTVRPKVGGFNLGMNLEAYPRDPTSVAGGDALRKAVEVKSPSKRGKEAVGTDGFVGRGSCDPVLLDEELALQLHLAMNGSQRISRSGNSSTGASVEPGKGNNGVVAGRYDNGNQEICITNMMAQLDDEAEPGRNRVLKRFRRSDSFVTVVLALECVKGIKWAGMCTVRYFHGKIYEWVGLSRQRSIMGKSKPMKKIEAFCWHSMHSGATYLHDLSSLFSFHVRYSTGNSLEKRLCFAHLPASLTTQCVPADHLLELDWDCACDLVRVSVISIRFDLFDRHQVPYLGPFQTRFLRYTTAVQY